MGSGHESRTLLMTRQNELDRGFSQALDDVEVFLAGNPKDAVDTFVFEGSNKQVRTLGHRLLLCRQFLAEAYASLKPGASRSGVLSDRHVQSGGRLSPWCGRQTVLDALVGGAPWLEHYGRARSPEHDDLRWRMKKEAGDNRTIPLYNVAVQCRPCAP
jgi:hypothetical protein